MTPSGPATSAYVEAAVETALRIHRAHAPSDGHILVFLTGQDEIERACALLRSETSGPPSSSSSASASSALLVIPLYGALSAEAQRLVFAKPRENVRKCVVATNIAETSVTVPHVRCTS
jgi:HrpA-like RNA helicase